MTQTDAESKFQHLPEQVRRRVEEKFQDSAMSLKILVGQAMADSDQRNEHAVSSAGRTGLTSGQVSELTVLVDLKPDGAKRLRKLFAQLDGNFAAADNVGSLHNMRFVFMDNDSKLLFATAYDGAWDPYIDDFATKIPELMDYVFGNVEGWPGIHSSAVKDFIADHQIPAAGWYVRHPQLTVPEATRLIALDESVNDFTQKLN